MPRLCVITVPGLSHALLSEVPANSSLGKWLAKQKILGMTPSSPGVSASVQATITTGKPPEKHGIISGGLPTFRFPQDQSLIDPATFSDYRKQIAFREPSNQFLDVPRFWQDENGKSIIKTALLFFEHSHPGFTSSLKPAADIVLTPMMEPNDRAIYSNLEELATKLTEMLGGFPTEKYWGPKSSIDSSRWIARSAVYVWQHYPVQLQLVSFPHLNFELTRYGPFSPMAANAMKDLSVAVEPLLDGVVGDGGKVLLIGEYAFRPVARVEYPNRVLADADLLKTHSADDGQIIDYEKSSAIAMVDHQFAHIYTRTPEDIEKAIAALTPIGRCWKKPPEGAFTMSWKHRRAGDIILEPFADAWYAYPWWTDASKAPAFAAKVSPHQKPGYDPLELFPGNDGQQIAQDNSLIRASHGVTSNEEAVIAGDLGSKRMVYLATEVAELIRGMLA